MKKRILSLVLALALVLTGVPMTFAATSGFSANAPQTQENTTGPLKMAVDTVEETVPASGLSSQAVAEGEEKIVHDASGRFSLKVEEGSAGGYRCGEFYCGVERRASAGCRFLR